MIARCAKAAARETSSSRPNAESLLAALPGAGAQVWRPLAALISALENGRADAAARATLAERARAAGAVPVLGVTGTGGAGKSSLTDELVRRFRLDYEDDLSIAILAVDPSRRKSGGALLGDRIRMNAIGDWGRGPRVFMRSLATRAAATELPDAIPDAIAACKAACGTAHMKTILGTGDLKTLRNVGRASLVALQAGSDFIKTSTGKEGVNATLPVALVMARAIRAYHEATGHVAGFKPAGGISTAKDAMNFQFLMKEELGRDWLEPGLFRFGASSLLADIERQLEHYVTGRYASFDHHAMA